MSRFCHIRAVVSRKSGKNFLCQDGVLYIYLIIWTQFLLARVYIKKLRNGAILEWKYVCQNHIEANQKGPLVVISPSSCLKQGLKFAQSLVQLGFESLPGWQLNILSRSSFTQCTGDDFLFSWNSSAAGWECCLSSCHCALLPLSMVPAFSIIQRVQ